MTTRRIDVAAVLAEHGIALTGGEALTDLEALAASHGWQVSTERLPLVASSRRCRALLWQPFAPGGNQPGFFVGRGSGPTETMALGRALAVALSRGTIQPVHDAVEVPEVG